jgi:class 3 adenylate cyclase
MELRQQRPDAQDDSYRIQPLTLRFLRAEEEAAFQADHFQKLLRYVRVGLLIAAVLIVVSTPLDSVIQPARLWESLLLRAGLLGASVGFLALTYSRHFKILRLPLGMGYILVFGLYMAAYLALEGTTRYVGPGFIACLTLVVGTHTLGQLGFIPALAISGGLIGMWLSAVSLFAPIESSVYLTYVAALFFGWNGGASAGYLVEWSTRREWAQTRLLEAERTKSDDLLLNILPVSIADRLKAGEQNIADSFAECTVLFADITGFTPLSQKVRPAELVAMLNRVFSAFDTLAEQCGLEKIKTMGDGYLAVAGIPIGRPHHVEAVADMALAMQEVIGDLAMETGYPLRLRIGIDTGGPVVAGIIGVRKFAYDLWGDVVNTAARMEAYSLPGCIHVTRAVYERLKEQYTFERREKIEVKGLGEMQTYFLTGRGVIAGKPPAAHGSEDTLPIGAAR